MNGNAVTVARNVVNGINVDDLFALIEGVKRDPSKGKTEWHVVTTWQGQTRSRAEVEGFGMGGNEVPRRSRSTSTNRATSALEPVCQSAGTPDRGAQRLHDGRVCRAMRRARHHSREPRYRDRRRNRPTRIPRHRSCREARLREPALH